MRGPAHGASSDGRSRLMASLLSSISWNVKMAEMWASRARKRLESPDLESGLFGLIEVEAAWRNLVAAVVAEVLSVALNSQSPQYVGTAELLSIEIDDVVKWGVNIADSDKAMRVLRIVIGGLCGFEEKSPLCSAAYELYHVGGEILKLSGGKKENTADSIIKEGLKILAQIEDVIRTLLNRTWDT
ncbi:MAG: hypothetical protein F7C35_02935 [Desulfurococcales archaeon]|nr:hypothetical protein [Desulfurococcales archaeon]